MARSGFEVQKVTVEALFLREIRTRFGKFRLGYLWAILEPSAHLLILLGIFGYILHRTMPIIARALLETLIYVAVYILLMLIVWMAGEYFEITNFLQLVLTWSLLIILSCGVGLIFMGVGKTFPEMQKVLPILLKPLFFISCIMFPLHSIPKQYWSYLLWNPLVHVVELSREAVMPGYISEGVSLNYLAMFTLVTLFIGLALYRTREEAMLTS